MRSSEGGTRTHVRQAYEADNLPLIYLAMFNCNALRREASNLQAPDPESGGSANSPTPQLAHLDSNQESRINSPMVCP
jgi:hypothetical protein